MASPQASQAMQDQAGLDDAEAALRLARDGPNVLPGSEPKALWRIVAGVLAEPMFLMLLAAGSIYLAIGDAAEAVFLLGSVLAIIGLTLAQERKTQRALEALRDLSAPRAQVLRGGRELRIASREVVRGDLLLLHEGDRIAADALLLQGQLSTDESLLTGESAPLDKAPQLQTPPDEAPLEQMTQAAHTEQAEQPNTAGQAVSAAIFASTVVTRGVGLARVTATGAQTAVGRIGAALAGTMLMPSNLQLASRSIVRRLAAVGLALALALVLLSWLWDKRPLLESLLLGIALAMAILPEEIPVVLTVFLALGAWRLSQQKVLTRRVQAVEALGAITVLAVDKTGTLTQNRMQVAELWQPHASFVQGEGQPLPEDLHELVEFALLATPADPFDPMEKAIRSFGHAHLSGTEHWHPQWTPKQVYPLSPQILAMTQVFARKPSDLHLLATKGAPEAVVDLCHLAPQAAQRVHAQAHAMAARGLRVLGVAKGQWQGGQWPTSQHDFSFELIGLIGLADPPRPDAAQAVADCRSAGIRIIMMTGDHPSTAQAIARQIGLDPGAGAALTGAQVAAMDDVALAERLRQTHLCARLAPEHKLRLVRLLQAQGESVGMTGDGVNDAPALKAAQVGIAMGERGTDVAREAAAIVLLDDSLASIVGAIRQGRRIYDNICKATRFIFAVHMPVIALALGPALFHWPMLLLPVQIVLLELIIDPACSVVFEAEPQAADIMARAPRLGSASPFEWRQLAPAVLQGLVLAAVLLLGAWSMVLWGWGAPDALAAHAALPSAAVATQLRTTVFMTLVLGLFLLVLANRDPSRPLWASMTMGNPWLWRMALGVLALLALALGLPWLRQVMGLALPSAQAWGVVVVLLAAFLACLELVRRAATRPGGAGRQRA